MRLDAYSFSFDGLCLSILVLAEMASKLTVDTETKGELVPLLDDAKDALEKLSIGEVTAESIVSQDGGAEEEKETEIVAVGTPLNYVRAVQVCSLLFTSVFVVLSLW